MVAIVQAGLVGLDLPDQPGELVQNTGAGLIRRQCSTFGVQRNVLAVMNFRPGSRAGITAGQHQKQTRPGGQKTVVN